MKLRQTSIFKQIRLNICYPNKNDNWKRRKFCQTVQLVSEITGSPLTPIKFHTSSPFAKKQINSFKLIQNDPSIHFSFELINSFAHFLHICSFWETFFFLFSQTLEKEKKTQTLISKVIACSSWLTGAQSHITELWIKESITERWYEFMSHWSGFQQEVLSSAVKGIKDCFEYKIKEKKKGWNYFVNLRQKIHSNWILYLKPLRSRVNLHWDLHKLLQFVRNLVTPQTFWNAKSLESTTNNKWAVNVCFMRRWQNVTEYFIRTYQLKPLKHKAECDRNNKITK